MVFVAEPVVLPLDRGEFGPGVALSLELALARAVRAFPVLDEAGAQLLVRDLVYIVAKPLLAHSDSRFRG